MKRAMSEESALAYGMLSPSSGVAALQTMLLDLTAATAPRVAGVLGVATQTYWRLLLSKFKPLPHLYMQLDFVLDSLKKVSTSAMCCITQDDTNGTS